MFKVHHTLRNSILGYMTMLFLLRKFTSLNDLEIISRFLSRGFVWEVVLLQGTSLEFTSRDNINMKCSNHGCH